VWRCMLEISEDDIFRIFNYSVAIFIVVPCILITSRFFSPTNALFY